MIGYPTIRIYVNTSILHENTALHKRKSAESYEDIHRLDAPARERPSAFPFGGEGFRLTN